MSHNANKDKEEEENSYAVTGAGAAPAPVSTFDAMGLKDDLLRGIYATGFEAPSPIQQRAILPMLQYEDVIAQAQSGSGKTAAFSIGLLNNVDLSNRECQALVLANTRELATQISTVVASLGSTMGVTVMTSIGGKSVRDDYKRLHQGVQLVVGTPGRVNDMLARKALNPDYLRYLVLDEADEMLSGDFKDQVYDVFCRLPAGVSVALFSATLSPDCLAVAEKFMRNPTQILVKQEQQTLDGIKQYFVFCEEERWKFPTLLDLYERINITQAVIFASTRKRVEWISQQMNEQDHTVASIHADLSHEEREQVMDHFRSGRARVLIATDVLARGIDVQQVSLVINYDLPSKAESYIHRIGRCGRFGRKGTAINLLTSGDVKHLRNIECYYHTEVIELPSDLLHLI